MIKTKEILVGSKKELLEELSKVFEGKKYIDGKLIKDGNILVSKEGMEKQLDTIIKQNGVGQVFYLDSMELLDKEPPEVNLTLLSKYVHIFEPITDDQIKKITKNLEKKQ